MRLFNLFLPIGIVLLLAACTADTEIVTIQHYPTEDFQIISRHLDLPEEPLIYNLTLPPHLSGSNGNTHSTNADVATLGRVLFYDTHLSRNESVSCASCHFQDKGFADDRALSEGFNGELTKRNSLALGATVSFRHTYGGGSSSFVGGGALFFWDERAHSIAEQSSMTIQDDIEMGMSMPELVSRLESVEYYQPLFKRAFGTETISENRITQALEEFISSIGAFNTRFDEGLSKVSHASQDFGNFTLNENLGKSLFVENCAGCHGERLAATPMTLANNGLDLDYDDQGVGDRSGLLVDQGVFKVPQLRNVALTGPYMHDGRFVTLEEVVDFYSEGIQAHPNLNEQLIDPTTGEPQRFNFSAAEKTALVDFLNTLTDETIATAERFSDPFRD